MVNNRVFYACQAVLLDVPKNAANISNHFLPGVQSVGVNSSENIITISDIGKSQGFKNLYSQPSNEITIERALADIDKFWLEKSSSNLFNSSNFTGSDQYRKSYFLKPENFGMSVPGFTTGQKAALQQYILPEYNLRLVYAPETSTVIGTTGLSGTALDIVSFPYCLMNSLSYSISVDGSFTESISLSNKVKKKEASNSYTFDTRGGDILQGATGPSSFVNVLRRRHIDNSLSVYPATVVALTDFNDFKDSKEIFGIKNIEINLNITYDQKQDIGQWRGANSSNHDELNMYTDLSNMEITCSFTITTKRSQQFSINNVDNNFSDERICIVAKARDPVDSTKTKFFIWNLGNKNRLTAFNQTGGDTSGGIVEYTVEYTNTNNDFVTYTQSQVGDLVLSPSLFQQTSEYF
jgi:hypothetical protein